MWLSHQFIPSCDYLCKRTDLEINMIKFDSENISIYYF